MAVSDSMAKTNNSLSKRPMPSAISKVVENLALTSTLAYSEPQSQPEVRISGLLTCSSAYTQCYTHIIIQVSGTCQSLPDLMVALVPRFSFLALKLSRASVKHQDARTGETAQDLRVCTDFAEVWNCVPRRAAHKCP